MTIQTFSEDLSGNTELLLQFVDSLTHTQLNYKQPGQWCVLEILEHLVLVDSVVLSILKQTSNMVAEENSIYGMEKMKKLMVEKRSYKVKAPSYLNPTGKISDIHTFKNTFIGIRTEFTRCLEEGEIMLDRRMFEHPVLGKMTVEDWLNFVLFHTERHLHQMRDLLDEA